MDLKVLEETPPWEWPLETDRFLRDVLMDDRAAAADRVLAAELAGNFAVINDDLARALLSILENGSASEDLRGTAAISLGPVLEQGDIFEFDDPDDVPISEDTFTTIQETLRRLFGDDRVPRKVRRRILEASVRAPQDWHPDAVRTAFASDNEAWRLTAVFAMRWIRGFEPQILEALESTNPDIHYQAVCAAGNWEVDEAWPHVSRLLQDPTTEKTLLLAAIDAVAAIRPQEAGMFLVDLTRSDDQDIVDAAHEAAMMAEATLEADLDDDADLD